MLNYNIILGTLLVTGGFAFLILKIKKNYFFGYRTFRSMKDSASWEFANRLASQCLVGIGLTTIVLDVLNYITFKVNFAYITACTIGLLMFMLIMIEWRLWLRQRNM